MPRWTRQSLSNDISRLGLRSGDSVLAHAGLRAIGPILGGPDTLIHALTDVLGPAGTLLAYADWQGEEELFADPLLRPHVPPFDPRRSRAARDNGAFPELLRTTPGALRSGNPGASCVALGARAEWFTANHALHYGYGENSPFAKLVAVGGKTLLVGAPLDTVTLLHHAEHLADIPGKRVKAGEVPLREQGHTVWQNFEEFDTADPVVDGLPENYFATIVEAYLEGGSGSRGTVGAARSVLLDAAGLLDFGKRWLEDRFPPRRPS